uniref:Uncharacterized protein n=1 Tax=Glossina austeni TaxID=7395 RepID=A0A1A9VN41_GLOAU
MSGYITAFELIANNNSNRKSGRLLPLSYCLGSGRLRGDAVTRYSFICFITFVSSSFIITIIMNERKQTLLSAVFVQKMLLFIGNAIYMSAVVVFACLSALANNKCNAYFLLIQAKITVQGHV